MTVALLLIALGLLLLVAEVFIPSGGILFILSMVALVVGVTMVFFAPESEGGGVVSGCITILVLIVLIPVLMALAFHVWPKTPIGKRFFLPLPADESPAAGLPDHFELSALKGQIGQTVTPHRPSGITLIQGHRIDTKTESTFLDAGQWVRVVDVRFGQVTVRPLSDSELGQLPEGFTT
jgi:membrane-bound serine protease (ClpP class)